MNKLMSVLNKAGDAIIRKTAKGQLVLKKKSPEILLGAGVIGFVGTVVYASRQTLKAKEIIKEHKHDVQDIETALKYGNKYTEEDAAEELLVRRAKTGVELVKLYGPVIALGTLSVASIITSRNILNKRYLGAVAAYNAVSEVFSQYRERVVKEYGEGLDRHFRYGTTYRTQTETVVDEDGTKRKEKIDIEETTNHEPPTSMSVVFDESNVNWDKDATFSMCFLRAQQNWANDRFNKKGHLFMNEVYDMLGFPDTTEGAVVGWVKGAGDDYIDFGLLDIHRENVRKFINGEENRILLEFNHDGIIFDKI